MEMDPETFHLLTSAPVNTRQECGLPFSSFIVRSGSGGGGGGSGGGSDGVCCPKGYHFKTPKYIIFLG